MVKKDFKLLDSVLMAVIVILVVEAAAPAAAIGTCDYSGCSPLTHSKSAGL